MLVRLKFQFEKGRTSFVDVIKKEGSKVKKKKKNLSRNFSFYMSDKYFFKGECYVVNSGRYQRYHGAEQPKNTKHDATLQGGAFGESGRSDRYSVSRAACIHLKPFFRIKIVQSEQLDPSLRRSNCTIHPF